MKNGITVKAQRGFRTNCKFPWKKKVNEKRKFSPLNALKIRRKISENAVNLKRSVTIY